MPDRRSVSTALARLIVVSSTGRFLLVVLLYFLSDNPPRVSWLPAFWVCPTRHSSGYQIRSEVPRFTAQCRSGEVKRKRDEVRAFLFSVGPALFPTLTIPDSPIFRLYFLGCSSRPCTTPTHEDCDGKSSPLTTPAGGSRGFA